MSYGITIETADGETRVTSTSGEVPAKLRVSGHVHAGDGDAGQSVYVSDGTLTASAGVAVAS